jgi:hypothetical protein
MKLIEKKEGKILLELSKQDFSDIYDAIFIVNQEYEDIDTDIFRVSLERVEELGSQMHEILMTKEA